jgi:hypothetical protein
MGIDADEMVFLPFFEERYAAAHAGIAHNDARPRLRMIARGIEGRFHGIDIVAVHALREPAKCFKLLDERLECHDLRRGTVGLLVVDVDHGDQVVELPVSGRHEAFPDSAFIEFAVGEERVDEGVRALALQSEAAAHRDRETVAKRAAGHLHAGWVMCRTKAELR